MTTWVKDNRGNKCSVEWFGSKEEAQKALDSLKNCDNCTNCSGCSDCSGCSRCSRCYNKVGLKAVEIGETNAGPPPVPVIENIHRRIYEAASAPGALNMSAPHTCEKTHCRAGWVVALAGPEGRALEAFYNWELAAILIYDASDPNFKINPARFYDRNDDAIADMKHLAAKAPAGIG